MNAARATPKDYIAFLAATHQRDVRCQPSTPTAPSHDAFPRLHLRLEPDPSKLWLVVRWLLPATGLLVFDDTAPISHTPGT